MKVDLFLGEKRWEILSILARRPSSPIEIAEVLSTTVSYISQQLKLLEVAGAVSKIKTGASEKGKPRNVYTLDNELVQLSLLTSRLSDKKILYLTPYHKAILNIWFLEDSSLHYPIEKLFWKLDENLGEIEGVFIEQGPSTKVLVISGSKEVKQKVDSFLKTLERRVDCSFIQKSNLSKVSLDKILVLYDPSGIIDELQKDELNGDLKKN